MKGTERWRDFRLRMASECTFKDTHRSLSRRDSGGAETNVSGAKNRELAGPPKEKDARQEAATGR